MELNQRHLVPVSVGCPGNSQLCSHFSQLVCLDVFLQLLSGNEGDLHSIVTPSRLALEGQTSALLSKAVVHPSSCVCH